MIYYNKTTKKKLQPNFNISEFRCTCNDSACDCTWHDAKLSAYLQAVRDHFGKPVHITSGYRCPAHNEAIGGAAKSRHTRGEAADFYVQDVSPADVAAYCESIGVLGIGCYDKGHGNFVHIDTREEKYFWQNASGNAVTSFGGEKQEGNIVPKAALYVVTIQDAQGEMATLLFDHSIGSYRQGGIAMTVSKDDATFTAETGVDILQITGI